MHDIRYDQEKDEIIVSNPFAQAVMAFRGDATGEEAPLRIIQGDKTQLKSPDRLALDPIHREIYVPNNRDAILVFDADAEGNAAPIRVIKGPKTRLYGVRAMAVDPVNNLLVAGTDRRRSGEMSSLVVFRRTDDGNVEPLNEIIGPNTGITRITQMQIYSPGGWIVASQPGKADQQEPEGAFIGIWSVHDDGDVPPKWVIGGPKSTLKKPRGVDLNPENKELIVADMRLNSILTFHFPELFDTKSEPSGGGR